MIMDEKIIREELINNKLKEEFFNKNYFVEAGAGAGKTTIITERIVNQIKFGYDVEKIVVITFTNKAANEIRDRIIMRINEEAKNEKDENLKKILLYANENIGKMQMSTIHSFCMKILKEQSFVSNLHIDVQLVEGEKEIEEKKYFFDNWYDNKFDDKKELEKKLKDFGVFSLYNYLFDNFCNMTNLLNDEDFILDKNEIKDDRYTDALEKYKANIKLKEIKGLNDEILRRQVQIDKLNEKRNIKNKELTEKEDEKLKSYTELNVVDNDRIVTLCKEYGVKKDDIEGIDKKIETNKLDIGTYLGAVTVDILQGIVREYRDTNRNVFITNNDLLRKTRKLFVNHDEMKKKYEEKIKCVYVDEFQDTNQVQIEFLTAMLSNDKGKLRNGSIFVVGDPKQSIYRFQGSDLQAYNNFKKKFDKDEIKVLNWNFRSNKLILDFVNLNNKKIFGDLDKETKDFYTIDYQDMERPRDVKEIDVKLLEDNTNLCGVYSLSNENEYKESDDINNVCSLIKKLVGSKKYKLVTWNNEKEEYIARDIQYKDILVISPKKSSMENYINAFNRESIPTQFTLKMNNSSMKQLYRFLYAYLYITNPYYDKAKYAFINMYCYDLVRDFKNNEEIKNVFNCMKEKTKDMDNFAKANYLINNYNILFNNDELSLVESRKLQTKLQQMLESVISNYDAMDLLKGFYEYVGSSIERDIALSENEDVVRFMNLHKVKGLQGNIVICVNREEAKEFRYSTHHEFDNNGKVQYYYSASSTNSFDKNGLPSYGRNKKILNNAKIEEMAEYDRLAYVECTRAKDVLIFMPPIINDNEYFCEYDFDDKNIKSLDYILDDKDEKSEDSEKTSKTKKTKNKEEGTQTPQNNNEVWQSKSNIDYASNDNNEICTSSPSDFEKNKGIEKNEKDENENDTVYGNIYGTIMHRGFELLVNENLAESKINYVINKSIVENISDLKYVYKEKLDKICDKIKEQLKKVYSDFIKNNEIKEILEGGTLYTEYHFNVLVDKEKNKELFDKLESYFKNDKDELMKKYELIVPKDAAKMYITGQADLIVEKNKELYIIDYKSDNNERYGDDFKDGLINAYEGQLELYAQVMKLLFENKKIHKYLYNNNELIKLDP